MPAEFLIKNFLENTIQRQWKNNIAVDINEVGYNEASWI